MNAVVDIGNSRIKIGFFEKGAWVQTQSYSSQEKALELLRQHIIEHTLISSVRSDHTMLVDSLVVTGKKIVLHRSLPLPIQLNYKSPETLGVDRVAAACGAAARYPGQACLVIDLGTCINYEFLDRQHVYQGGIISPGVRMRFRAMHEQTAALPLIDPPASAALLGQSTRTCLESGVMNGIRFELEGIIESFQKQSNDKLAVILTGGDAELFENQLKPPIFVAPNLVLEGLNSILEHNVAHS